MSYWQNYKKFFVSFQKTMFGDAAKAENDWAYRWLPKLDVAAMTSSVLSSSCIKGR